MFLDNNVTFSIFTHEMELYTTTLNRSGSNLSSAEIPGGTMYIDLTSADRISVIIRQDRHRNPDTVTVVAAKLEFGDKQTLAHQDEDGNWVLNDPPPNKEVELAKCQRYYEDSGWVTMMIYGSTLDITVPWKVNKVKNVTSKIISFASNVEGHISAWNSTGSTWVNYPVENESSSTALAVDNGQRVRASSIPNNSVVKFKMVSSADL